MYVLYRWWARYRLSLILTLLTLGTAWFLKASQGAVLTDLYRWMTLPVQPDLDGQQQLIQAKTRELEQRVQELEAQNRALQALLKQPVMQQEQAIAAAVIGRSADQWWQQLTLARGEQDQVPLDAAVVAPGGLVGRVIQVAPQTSRVLLVTDPSSRVGVTVSRSRQVGILRGQTDEYGIVDFFEKDPDVRVGDTLVTSSLSRLFPAGIPVGQVKTLKPSATGIPQAVVEFSAPMGRLEWVSILFHGQTSQATVSPRP